MHIKKFILQSYTYNVNKLKGVQQTGTYKLQLKKQFLALYLYIPLSFEEYVFCVLFTFHIKITFT